MAAAARQRRDGLPLFILNNGPHFCPIREGKGWDLGRDMLVLLNNGALYLGLIHRLFTAKKRLVCYIQLLHSVTAPCWMH